jgi:protoporphyrinogen oxidase
MAEEKTNIKVIILGAGVTGLSVGVRFLENGCDVCIVEKAEHVGGLAKTVVRGEYLLDLGPHHIYSKNESILKEMLDLFEKDEIAPISIQVKMLFHDRFVDYPLSAKTVLSQMGPKHAFYGSLSYVWTAFRNLCGLKLKEKSFHDWARNNFGDYLYGIFFKPYTEQFWGVPCEELSVDCIPQVKKQSFMQTLKNFFLERFANERLSASEHDIAWEKSLNFYPVKGFGAVSEKLKDSFLSKGGTLRLNCDISELTINDDNTYTLNYSNGVESFEEEATYVVSSIPVPSLFQILKPTPPASVVQSSDSLKYLSAVVLYIVIQNRDVLETSFVYMVGRPYNRLSNTNRMQPNLCPAGENMLACEITCSFNDEIWKSSDEEIFEKCISHLESDKFISREEVKKIFTVRAKNAYPFYRLGYKENLSAVFEYFKNIPNLTLAGRVGAFKYMDTHECLEDTANLVEELKNQGTI